MSLHDERLSFLGRQLPPEFELRELSLPTGDRRAFDDREWRDAIVVVESGELELECQRGVVYQFRSGDVLWLIGLPLVAMHNPGPMPALLTAISRRPSRPAGTNRAALVVATPDRVDD
jgi:hypothetical protein